MELTGESFSRSVVREYVPVEGRIATIARRRAKLMRTVLEANKLYCYFERDADHPMLCAFSAQPGHLFAETVLRWMRQRDGVPNFLFCERFDNEGALVCVINGQIVREEFVRLVEVGNTAGQMLERLLESTPDSYCVYLHGIDSDILKQDVDFPVELISDSIIDYAEDSEIRLPELTRLGSAIGKLSRAHRLLRLGMIVFPIILIGLGLIWTVLNVLENVQENTQIFEQIETLEERTNQYNELLHLPDPGDQILAIHRVYRDFLGDPLSSVFDGVESMAWLRDSGELEVHVKVLKVLDHRGEPWEISDDLERWIQQRTEMRGWEFKGSPREPVVKFHLPVKAEGRSGVEVDAARVLAPEEKTHKWHVDQLSKDFKQLGALLNADTAGGESEIYRSFESTLTMSDVEWAQGHMPTALAKRLAGGPLILESAALTSHTKAGEVSGTLTFLHFWRSPPKPEEEEANDTNENDIESSKFSAGGEVEAL